ncbi:MAG: Z1 domain-containing protein [bacterium]|nr:Z1 domain-containing protein [bacterium]
MIKTLSDAVTIVEFLASHQGKSVEDALEEAAVPMHLREQVRKYFSPPLDIIPPDLIVDNTRQIPRCNPESDSMQQYFGAFQRFLIDERGWPKSTIDALSETSLDLIRRLPKPEAVDEFQIRGLVLGHIQSGKTASMAALIARAADEGYKLFIVMSGLWKDLRAQTQKRLDKEITGESDDPTDAPYVEYDAALPKWVRLTQSGTEKDFISGGPNDLNPQTLKLAVIKKNTRIESLMKWLKKSPVPLRELPAIIIDDEADHGSIDTNYGKKDDDGEKIDPTITNQRIRDLLKALPKSVYVGFTATPFANVLIDASVDEDLYPRDFIATLPEPAGYFGPRRLFGLGLEPSDLSPVIEEKPALNVLQYVEDQDVDEIDRVLESESGNSCPRVLSEALLAFLLSSCGRLARGHNKEHFSMLVHPSQKTEPHRIFARTIREELQLLKSAAMYPKKFPHLLTRAKTMWDTDFCKVTHEQNDPELIEYDFETVWKFAKSITEAIEIKILNYDSDDKLEYSDGSPRRYVVIGGNKLSRGLTLEGLSVSVFTRSANQYDTLLQMGRWFGYRPQYYDLTRIYVTRILADRFAELARIEEEFRADLKKYAEEPDPPTPLQLKPIIRVHPAMAITSRMKMGAGKSISMSFQNTRSETVALPVENKTWLQKNLRAAQALISHLTKSVKHIQNNGTYIWKDIPAAIVMEFLHDYEFSREAREVSRQNLINYIKRQNEHGELALWDIVLPRGNPQMEPYAWTKDIFTHKIIRTPMTARSIRVLSSPSDIDSWRKQADRDPKDAKHGGIMLYLVDQNSVATDGTKFFSNSNEGEDILGLVFIFPESKSNVTIEYVSQ